MTFSIRLAGLPIGITCTENLAVSRFADLDLVAGIELGCLYELELERRTDTCLPRIARVFNLVFLNCP